MKIEYRLGDFFTVPDAHYLVHGCNAMGEMGRGVAYTMRYEIYPKVWIDYRKHYDRYGLRVGDVVPVRVDSVIYQGQTYPPRTVFNAITQEKYSGAKEGHVYADYEGIRQAMRFINKTVDMAHENSVPKVAMPLIGAGLARGDWGRIADIIESESEFFEPVVYAYSPADLERALQAVKDYQKNKS